ncbi:unnamed protein product, partial [Brachionus calyciflorus]
YLCLWDLKNGTLMYFESKSKVSSIEILDNNTVIYSEKDGHVNLFNLSDFEAKNILNTNGVNDLKMIKKCNLIISEDYFLTENTSWSPINSFSPKLHSTNNFEEITLLTLTTLKSITRNNLSQQTLSNNMSIDLNCKCKTF